MKRVIVHSNDGLRETEDLGSSIQITLSNGNTFTIELFERSPNEFQIRKGWNTDGRIVVVPVASNVVAIKSE